MKIYLSIFVVFIVAGCISRSDPVEYVWTDDQGYLSNPEELKQAMYRCKYDVLETGLNEKIGDYVDSGSEASEKKMINKAIDIALAGECMNNEGFYRRRKGLENTQPDGVVVEERLDRH